MCFKNAHTIDHNIGHFRYSYSRYVQNNKYDVLCLLVEIKQFVCFPNATLWCFLNVYNTSCIFDQTPKSQRSMHTKMAFKPWYLLRRIFSHIDILQNDAVPCKVIIFNGPRLPLLKTYLVVQMTPAIGPSVEVFFTRQQLNQHHP